MRAGGGLNECGLDALEIGRRLIAAEAICAAQGQRLNAPGRRVLRALLSHGRPLKAYDLMHELAEGGRSASPPTVYRALKFLTGAGLVHRVECLNAFVACRYPGHPHLAGFHVCQRRRTAEEFQLESAPAGLPDRSRLVFEVLVDCSACACAPA